MSYFVRIRGKAFGPFDGNQLVDMKTKGKLGKASEISENRIDWFPAEELDFLFPPPASPEPPARETASPHPAAPSPPETADWFYSVNGTEGYGPITRTALIQMIRSGKLIDESYVWQQGQHARHLKTETVFSGYLGTSSGPHDAEPSQTESSQTGPSKTESTSEPSTTGPSITGGRFCSACGNPIVPTAAMCPRCGSPIQRSYLPLFPSSLSGIGYVDVLKKYSDFSGRARRREFWSFTLINELLIPFFVGVLIFLIALMSVTGAGFQGILSLFTSMVEPVGNQQSTPNTAASFMIQCVLGLHLVFKLAILLPSLAVCVRRLHDTGNSGWMLLILLVPVAGAIALFVFLVQDTQPGDNLYGPNPKYT